MQCAMYFDVSSSTDQAKLRKKIWGKQKLMLVAGQFLSIGKE
jgi:hypothetical protein